MKGIIVSLIAAFCVVYLLNPTMGVIEFIPDNFPIIGNLDEATATAVLLACARYFGFDLSKFFGRKEDEKNEVVDID
ncbi:MAG: DUF1232 domain-containing protein [Akkermansiaceae bacterium]|jgi:uncharacterized membrane protein YkvA (DUF1232 family)|tara:strand:- start:195 stop:425 length:231 start_codon:yes stop_codon:yes gene_type:complete